MSRLPGSEKNKSEALKASLRSCQIATNHMVIQIHVIRTQTPEKGFANRLRCHVADVLIARARSSSRKVLKRECIHPLLPTQAHCAWLNMPGHLTIYGQLQLRMTIYGYESQNSRRRELFLRSSE